jgi:outer membrane protein TolC
MSWGGVWIGLFALGIGTAAIATQPEPAPPPSEPSWRGSVLTDQWRPIPHNLALDVPSPITQDTEIQRVTLKEAIGIALENNPGIAARRLEPARVGTNVLGAQSEFDPSLGGDLNYSNTTTPNANGLNSTPTSVVNDRYANFHLSKLLRTGTLFQTNFLNDRLDNNASFVSLRPQYHPELGFSVLQPLLRDFGWDFSYLVVRVAEKESDSAVYLYEADLANFVDRVIRAYWGVVGQRETLQASREAKQLADRTVEENEARVRVGLFPPVAVLEAQADAASRENDVIAAENNLAVARQQLAQLCFYRPAGTFVPRTLEPADEAELEEVHANVDETLTAALHDRPEITASALGVDARQVNERIASNGLLPRLDLVGGYSVNGLSGPAQVGSLPFISPTNLNGTVPGVSCDKTPIFMQDGTSLFNCTRALPPSSFAGSQTDAYGTRPQHGGLLSGDFNTYSFGVRLTVPFDNAAAQSVHSRSQIELDQAQLNHRQLLSDVTLEVRQAVADVVSSRQRIDSARVASNLAEENLRNQEKRHEVGMATTKDLLDFQTRLTEARLAEVTAKYQYNIAVAEWRRAHGHLLDHYQIVVDHPGTHNVPWFARF